MGSSRTASGPLRAVAGPSANGVPMSQPPPPPGPRPTQAKQQPPSVSPKVRAVERTVYPSVSYVPPSHTNAVFSPHAPVFAFFVARLHFIAFHRFRSTQHGLTLHLSAGLSVCLQAHSAPAANGGPGALGKGKPQPQLHVSGSGPLPSPATHQVSIRRTLSLRTLLP
jgi:hypothetical protein